MKKSPLLLAALGLLVTNVTFAATALPAGEIQPGMALIFDFESSEEVLLIHADSKVEYPQFYETGSFSYEVTGDSLARMVITITDPGSPEETIIDDFTLTYTTSHAGTFVMSLDNENLQGNFLWGNHPSLPSGFAMSEAEVTPGMVLTVARGNGSSESLVIQSNNEFISANFDEEGDYTYVVISENEARLYLLTYYPSRFDFVDFYYTDIHLNYTAPREGSGLLNPQIYDVQSRFYWGGTDSIPSAVAPRPAAIRPGVTLTYDLTFDGGGMIAFYEKNRFIDSFDGEIYEGDYTYEVTGQNSADLLLLYYFPNRADPDEIWADKIVLSFTSDLAGSFRSDPEWDNVGGSFRMGPGDSFGLLPDPGYHARESAVFGRFNDRYFDHPSDSGWINHEEHGWLYVWSPGLDAGAWAWDHIQQEWLWTNLSIYPFFFNETRGWSYYEISGSKQERWFYFYDVMKWEKVGS